MIGKFMGMDDSTESNNTVLIGLVEQDNQSSSFLNSLSHAIRNSELCLHYQPRYNALTGKVDAFEALVRWERPSIGLIYPETFLSQAEKSGLILNLDIWVFEQCCKDLICLQNEISPQVKISINISVQACEKISYLQKIIKLSDKYGVHISNFEFDISRFTYAYDVDVVASFCEALKNFGVKFSINNFAVGLTASDKLWSLANTLIINKDLIHEVGTSKNSEEFIRSMVNMAKQNGVNIIAEGIESREQRIFASDLGCDYLQGFLLCRPLKIAKIKSSILYES